jgi:NTP pyrophosphatase (non-canonical NTP hydrolase)
MNQKESSDMAKFMLEGPMNYRAEVERTLNGNVGDQLLTMGGLGLAGEAGEVADLIKKVIYHNKPLDRAALIRELGDVLWYLEALMIAIDTNTEEVQVVNIAKLRARYPNGFNTADANARKDEQV